MIRDNHKQFMERIMEPEHSKQGKARGSTSLSGKKVRLLAMALLLAVMAGVGFAIGEEKSVAGQSNQQEADSKDIHIDVPIQPSAIITKDGVVIPKYEDGANTTKDESASQRQRSIEREMGIIRGLNKTFLSLKVDLKEDVNYKKSENGGASDALPSFTRNFQMEDAIHIEEEYKYVMPAIQSFEIRRMREEADKRQKEWDDIRGNNMMGMLMINFMERKLKISRMNWKFLGKRIVLGEKKYVFQTSFVFRGASIQHMHFDNVNLPSGAMLFAYGIDGSMRWRRSIQEYTIVSESTKSAKRQTINDLGSVVVMELISDNVINIADIEEYFSLVTLAFSFKGKSSNSMRDEKSTNAVMREASRQFC